jgi:diguanylate cyclase (GGDEF)-like protein
MSSDPRKDLLVLRHVTEVLSRERTLEYALGEVTDAALQLLPGDHASIRMLDASGTKLLAAARSGAGAAQRSLELSRGEGIAGWVLKNAKPALVADARADARFLDVAGQGFTIRSMVAEPLMSAGSAVGVLSVSASQVNVFTQADEQLARILANCCVPLLDRARLERLAVTDELTLAFNGNYLPLRLGEEMERARHAGTALSVVAMDLDQLEKINVAYGRDLGDRVLSIVADRVRALSRRYDAFVRCGGDEFVVVLPDTSPTQAMATAERLRAAMADEPMEPRPGGLLTQTVSVGVATWDGSETVDELLQRAAGGVYVAKQRGGNAAARAIAREPGDDAP